MTEDRWEMASQEEQAANDSYNDIYEGMSLFPLSMSSLSTFGYLVESYTWIIFTVLKVFDHKTIDNLRNVL